MKVKHLAIAVGVLAVLSIAAWFAKRDPGQTALDPREGQPLLEKTVVEKIAAIRLHTPTGEIDLAKPADAGSRWTVKSYFDLPADFSKIKTFIDNLRDAKIERFASAREERIATMGFDGTTVELRGADDKVLRTLHLGKNDGSGGRFIKLDDEKKAYVATLSAYLDATAKNWADAALLAAKPEDVVALEISFPDGGTMKLKRENSTAPWTTDGLAEGEKLKDSDVSSLVSKFTGLRFSDTAEPTAEDVVAARANSRAFQVTLASGKTYDISMGRKPAPPARPAPPPPEPGPDGKTPPAPPAPPAPQPGPVYVQVKSSDASDSINASMQRRAFQIYEWTFTSLPANRAALVEAAPAKSAPTTATAPAPQVETTPAPATATTPAPAADAAPAKADEPAPATTP